MVRIHWLNCINSNIFHAHARTEVRGEDSGYFVCAAHNDMWNYAELIVKSK